jgi:hypothetical protein
VPDVRGVQKPRVSVFARIEFFMNKTLREAKKQLCTGLFGTLW